MRKGMLKDNISCLVTVIFPRYSRVNINLILNSIAVCCPMYLSQYESQVSSTELC